MQPRTAAILVAMALGLAALVYVFEIGGERERLQSDEASRALFPDVDAADVEAIEVVTSDGRPTRLEREDGRWTLVEPLRFPADGVTLDGMASTLAGLAFDEEIARPAGREVYGLADPAGRIRFEAGPLEGELWVGKPAPAGGRSYVAMAGEGDARVFVVPTWRVTSLRRSLDELRDRRVLPFDRAAVERVEVRWPEARVVLAREGEGWRLEVPVVGPADPATVDDLLSDLAFLRAEGFLDEPTAEVLAELESPAFGVTLRGGGEGASGAPGFSASLTLGGFHTRRLRIARGAHPTALYLVGDERLEELPRSVLAYRSRALSRYDAEEAFALELRFAPDAEGGDGETLYARYDDDGWQVEGATVDPAPIAALVAELTKLEASEIVAEEMGEDELAALGLAPPRVSVRVYGAFPAEGPAPVLAAFDLGLADPLRGTFATRPDESLVYAIDPELASRLPRDAASLTSAPATP